MVIAIWIFKAEQIPKRVFCLFRLVSGFYLNYKLRFVCFILLFFFFTFLLILCF